MITITVPTKPYWSGLVLSIQNLSYHSEFVHLPSRYRPLGILFRHMASLIKKWPTPLEILLWAMFGSSNRTITQKQTLKTTQKWVTGLLPFESSDLNPVINEWGIWRIWSDSGLRNGLWSLVRCSLTSSGIIGEDSYSILANGGFKKYWIKGYL